MDFDVIQASYELRYQVARSTLKTGLRRLLKYCSKYDPQPALEKRLATIPYLHHEERLCLHAPQEI